VVLGDHRTRVLYAACIVIAFCAAVAIGTAKPLALIALAAVPLALAPLRLVRQGASGPGLITALGQTGRLQLAFGLLLTLGLAIRP
jgi:1,4-dihydroxy-2-naphthoate octaprenyltransferase